MTVDPFPIAEQHIQERFSDWGAIHPDSIVHYPEVFQFSITSKAFLAGEGNPPIGLGPTLISMQTGRLHQYGSGEGYYLLDFLIREFKLAAISRTEHTLRLEGSYSLSISSIVQPELFRKYFRALLSYRPKLKRDAQQVDFLTLADQELVATDIPTLFLRGEQLLDFLFYNTQLLFCNCMVEESAAPPVSNDHLGPSTSAEALPKYIQLLQPHLQNMDRTTWLSAEDYDTFVLYRFYADGEFALTAQIRATPNEEALIYRKATQEIRHLNFLSSIRADYLSTYLFVAFAEEQISKALPNYQGVHNHDLVIEEIYDLNHCLQYLMTLKSRFTYDEGEAHYHPDPNWNWNYYFNDEARLENKLQQLPAHFPLEDLESAVFFLFANLNKEFCKLRLRPSVNPY